MKPRHIALCMLTVLVFSYISCKKNDAVTTVVKDISTLPLAELKNTLNGNWKLVYTWQFYQGRKDYLNTYINFFNFADSISWKENNVETVRTKATYSKGLSISSGSDSVYTISYLDIRYNLTRFWGANKMLNDTLILSDNQQTNPTSYYLIK